MHQPRQVGQDTTDLAGALPGLAQPAERAEVVLDPLLGDRFGGDPHVELRIEPARDTLHDHHALLQQHEFRPRLHVEDVGVGKQLAKKVGHRDFGCRAAVDRLTDGAHGLGEHLDLVVGRHIAEREVDFGRPPVVARDQAVQHLSKKTPLARADAADNAKVDSDHTALRIDEQVALVHVAMEEAVAHGVAQERADDCQAERLAVEAALIERRMVGDRRAVDPLDRQDALAGPLPVDGRHPEIGNARDIVRHLGYGGRLQPQVHLKVGRPLEVGDDGDRPQPAGRRIPGLDLAGREGVAVEITLEALLDMGPEDLDRHGPAAAVGVDHFGLVDLSDRGGRNRRPERDEVVFELATQFALDRGTRLGHREWRQPILQRRQVAGEFRADKIGAGGEKLAELDIARTEAR